MLDHLARNPLPVIRAVARVAPGLTRQEHVDPPGVVPRHVSLDGRNRCILDAAAVRQRWIAADRGLLSTVLCPIPDVFHGVRHGTRAGDRPAVPPVRSPAERTLARTRGPRYAAGEGLPNSRTRATSSPDASSWRADSKAMLPPAQYPAMKYGPCGCRLCDLRDLVLRHLLHGGPRRTASLPFGSTPYSGRSGSR